MAPSANPFNILFHKLSYDAVGLIDFKAFLRPELFWKPEYISFGGQV